MERNPNAPRKGAHKTCDIRMASRLHIRMSKRKKIASPDEERTGDKRNVKLCKAEREEAENEIRKIEHHLDQSSKT